MPKPPTWKQITKPPVFLNRLDDSIFVRSLPLVCWKVKVFIFMTCSVKGGAAWTIGKSWWVILLKADLSGTIYPRVQDAVIYSRASQASVRNSVLTEIQNQAESRMNTAGKVRTFLYPHDLGLIMWDWFLKLWIFKKELNIWDISWGIKCLEEAWEGGAYQCANKMR